MSIYGASPLSVYTFLKEKTCRKLLATAWGNIQQVKLSERQGMLELKETLGKCREVM
jgi:hypothetical protein